MSFLDLVHVASDLQQTSSSTSKHDILVAEGVLEAYCALIATRRDVAPLCKALRITKDDLQNILFQSPNSQHQVLTAELVSLTHNSLKVLNNFCSTSMDKDEANAAKHHKAILDAAIRATATIAQLKNENTGIIVNNVVQIGSNEPPPATPKLLNEYIDNADIA